MKIDVPPLRVNIHYDEQKDAAWSQGGPHLHRELISSGCISCFATYSPILSPMSVPTRVEER